MIMMTKMILLIIMIMIIIMIEMIVMIETIIIIKLKLNVLKIIEHDKNYENKEFFLLKMMKDKML